MTRARKRPRKPKAVRKAHGRAVLFFVVLVLLVAIAATLFHLNGNR